MDGLDMGLLVARLLSVSTDWRSRFARLITSKRRWLRSRRGDSESWDSTMASIPGSGVVDLLISRDVFRVWPPPPCRSGQGEFDRDGMGEGEREWKVDRIGEPNGDPTGELKGDPMTLPMGDIHGVDAMDPGFDFLADLWT